MSTEESSQYWSKRSRSRFCSCACQILKTIVRHLKKRICLVSISVTACIVCTDLYRFGVRFSVFWFEERQVNGLIKLIFSLTTICLRFNDFKLTNRLSRIDLLCIFSLVHPHHRPCYSVLTCPELSVRTKQTLYCASVCSS